MNPDDAINPKLVISCQHFAHKNQVAGKTFLTSDVSLPPEMSLVFKIE
jgi:hypothetical protein